MASKLNRLTLRLTTGARGRADLPVVHFNGHPLPLNGVEGSCDAGETLQGSIRPASVAHSVHLVGPGDGTWDISSLSVDYEADTGSWTVDFGSFELDGDSSADIFELPPLPTWDV